MSFDSSGNQTRALLFHQRRPLSGYSPFLQEGITFLNDVMRGLKAAQTSDADQPILFLQMQTAQYEHVLGNFADAKKMLEEGRRTLDEKSDADPAVSASVHYLAMQLAKEAQSYADFYRASLMYLAFVPQETLDPDQRLALAVDISLAALLGEDIYNFGELLLHPILSTLKDSDYDWLLDILYCFESGNLHEYDTLCSKYASSLNAQPALVANERRLREKITIAALLELIGNLPAESRTLKLSEVAAKTKLPADGVELLLMRALALHLIEGVIDGVNGEVSVGWIAPRVLTHRQVESMASRLEGWLARVETAALMFKEESVGLVM